MPSLARAFRRRRGDGDGEEDTAPDTDFGASLPGLDDETLPDSDAGAGSSVTSVVSPGRAAPQLPKLKDRVSDEDYSKYYSMLGQAPTEKDPGKASQVLSVLSNLFMHQDIPGELRHAQFQRDDARYQKELAPLKARIDTGLGAYKADVDAAEKQATINRQTSAENYYDRRGPTPTPVHYGVGMRHGPLATGLDEPWNYSQVGQGEPQYVNPAYEKPNAPHHNTPDEQYIEDQQSQEPAAQARARAYEKEQRTKGMTGAKVEQGGQRIEQGNQRIEETKRAHTDTEHSRAHAQATKEILAHQFDYDDVADAIDKRYQEILQSGEQGDQSGAPPPGSKVRVYNQATGKLE